MKREKEKGMRRTAALAGLAMALLSAACWTSQDRLETGDFCDSDPLPETRDFSDFENFTFSSQLYGLNPATFDIIIAARITRTSEDEYELSMSNAVWDENQDACIEVVGVPRDGGCFTERSLEDRKLSKQEIQLVRQMFSHVIVGCGIVQAAADQRFSWDSTVLWFNPNEDGRISPGSASDIYLMLVRLRGASKE